MAECIQVTAGWNWGDGDPMDAPTSFGFLDIEHLFGLLEDFFRVFFSICWQNAILSEFLSACIEISYQFVRFQQIEKYVRPIKTTDKLKYTLKFAWCMGKKFHKLPKHLNMRLPRWQLKSGNPCQFWIRRCQGMWSWSFDMQLEKC